MMMHSSNKVLFALMLCLHHSRNSRMTQKMDMTAKEKILELKPKVIYLPIKTQRTL